MIEQTNEAIPTNESNESQQPQKPKKPQVKRKTISAQLTPDIIEKFEYIMKYFEEHNLTSVNKSDTLRIMIEKTYREITEENK